MDSRYDVIGYRAGDFVLMICPMNKSYHICVTSHNEVLFRSRDDYYRGFNCYALALLKNGSVSLSDSLMSNHAHFVFYSSNYKEVVKCFRLAYSMYFNRKYRRSGQLFDPEFYVLEVQGLRHHLAALSYVMRNCVHHGLCSTPYAYEHSSSNVFFRDELGKSHSQSLLPRHKFKKFIGKDFNLPDGYRMSEGGLLLREDFTDVAVVERMFSTARSFNFYMLRKTSEEWLKEQSEDNNGLDSITLHDIEHGFIGTKLCNCKKYGGKNLEEQEVDKMLVNEWGKANCFRISDMELCGIIDQLCITEFKKHSVYELSYGEKCEIAKYVRGKYYPSLSQLRRCLVLNNVLNTYIK